ncbi:SWIM zinc finger family protein [Paenibacillus caui]|uniref:SWIM zinc finger family protein n=1 Tax=Paenibacillus caui TaxID=2873927 RepID=UPI001CA8A752|nr:hypothetical protein [Paenibacillus caui]
MQQTDLIDDAGWNLLLQNVAENFNEVTLSRGFHYYKQGRVAELTLDGPRTIQARVKGTKSYEVDINLDFFTLSGCSCPVEGTCKHMAAVLLKYAEEQGRSVNALANAKANQILEASRGTDKPAAPYLAPKAAAASRAAIMRQQLMEQAHLLADMDIPEWHRLFEQCTAALEREIRNSAYAGQALKLIFEIKPKLSPLLEQLFGLHAHLFVLKALLQPAAVPGFSSGYGQHLGYFTHIAVSEMDDAVLMSLESPLSGNGLEPPAEPEQQKHIGQTLSYLRTEMLTEPQGQSYFSRYYFLFWTNWTVSAPGKTRLYEQELKRLELAEQELGSELAGYPLLLAKSRMHFFLSRDAEAWSLLHQAGERFGVPGGDLLDVLDRLAGDEDWQRLTAWLAETAVFFTFSPSGLLDDYFSCWEMASAHFPDAEPIMWNVLRDMLPSAGRYYERKLAAHGKWQEWMDYQLSAGTEPLDYRAKDLQIVEKEAPELLLPFYHQAVERYVTQKNRDSYKAAVKLLKRLSKLYKKMKRQARWEQFLSEFTSRHSRLRALQEELRKGKLIS